MNIKILGTGCPKCKTTEAAMRTAVEKYGITAEIEKVEDIMQIMEYNVLTTPAVVIDGVVCFKGGVPSADQIKTMLKV